MIGASTLSRKGRTRITGPRYPSGRLKQVEGLAPATIKRMVAMAQVGAADPLLATQLGWLRLMKIVTDRQAAAGVMWASLSGQNDRARGLPRRTTASPSYERGFVGNGAVGGADFEQAKIDRIRTRFNAAHAVLIKQGLTATRAVNAVCVDDRCLDWDRHEHFENGLDALADHFKVNVKDRG
jgi:hypothetical protein